MSKVVQVICPCCGGTDSVIEMGKNIITTEVDGKVVNKITTFGYQCECGMVFNLMKREENPPVIDENLARAKVHEIFHVVDDIMSEMEKGSIDAVEALAQISKEFEGVYDKPNEEIEEGCSIPCSQCHFVKDSVECRG